MWKTEGAVAHLVLSICAALFAFATLPSVLGSPGGAPLGLVGWIAAAGVIESLRKRPARLGVLPLVVMVTCISAAGPPAAVTMLAIAGVVYGLLAFVGLLVREPRRSGDETLIGCRPPHAGLRPTIGGSR